MKEEWKDIVNFEGLYQISNLGRVKALHYHRGNNRDSVKCLSPRFPKDRYPYVGLCKDNHVKHCYIHRLVAEHFIPKIDGKPQVNHKDGVKSNNCVDNLEWVSARENTLHARRVLKIETTKKYKFGLHKSSKEVCQYYVDEDGNEYLIATYVNAHAASIVNKIHAQSINACCRGDKNYTHAGGYMWRFKEEPLSSTK